jgi:integrase
MAGLKNLTRVETSRFGHTTWELLDAEGVPVQAFSYFCEKNWDYAFATQKRYAEVVAGFLDYLIEAKAFGASSAPTKRHLNEVIDAYPVLLRDGSHVLWERIVASLELNPEDKWLADVCQDLRCGPLKPGSFSNTLAAINRFLRLSEALAVESFERAQLLGLEHEDTYSSLITALLGNKTLSAAEIRNMRMNSVLGSVMRFRGEGLTRPRRLTCTTSSVPTDMRNLDFPLDYVLLLASAASSWRDCALWLLLAASGIRVSEALNLQWSDVDIQNQKVYVLDPNGRRLGGDMTALERARFKGREVSMTYLIQPFRQALFQALEQYVKNEYVPPRSKSGSDYVFQYIEPGLRGNPYVGASDTALNKSFKAACQRAGVPPPVFGEKKYWVLHSLRHLYGVYMVNDFPVDPENGRFGLELAEVQVLMVHKSINSTRIYARKKRRSIERLLALADRYLLGLNEGQLLAIPRDTKGAHRD